jgi:hypothetical protein
LDNKFPSDPLFKTIGTFIKHYYKHGIAVAVVLGVVVVVAIIFGRQIEWREWGRDFEMRPGPSIYKERRISADFDNKPLVWAVEHLKSLAPEVNIVLRHDLTDGSIETKNFSVHLREAPLEDVLDAFCANAATKTKLKWRRVEGRNILIEPDSPAAT